MGPTILNELPFSSARLLKVIFQLCSFCLYFFQVQKIYLEDEEVEGPAKPGWSAVYDIEDNHPGGYYGKHIITRQVSSMIHSTRPTVTPEANIVFCCFVLLDLKSGDGRTDNKCENNDPYRPRLWVGPVDQKEQLN